MNKKNGNINPLWNDIAVSHFGASRASPPTGGALCCPCLWHLRRGQHIFNKYAVSRGRIVYQNVRHRAHYLAVLDDGAAAHECVQEGTTLFNEKFTKKCREPINVIALGKIFN